MIKCVFKTTAEIELAVMDLIYLEPKWSSCWTWRSFQKDFFGQIELHWSEKGLQINVFQAIIDRNLSGDNLAGYIARPLYHVYTCCNGQIEAQLCCRGLSKMFTTTGSSRKNDKSKTVFTSLIFCKRSVFSAVLG